LKTFPAILRIIHSPWSTLAYHLPLIKRFFAVFEPISVSDG
jgi:hypothetical protein